MCPLYSVPLRLAAFCQRCYPFFFFRRLFPVGCRFLAGFRLASYTGVGMGCEAPRLRSILRIFEFSGWILYPSDFLCICILYGPSYQVRLVSWYPRFPCIVVEAIIPRDGELFSLSLRIHLSGGSKGKKIEYLPNCE